jgi:uncharacterized protein (DUF2147 family)
MIGNRHAVAAVFPLLTLSTLALSTLGAAAAPQDPSGTYLTEDGRARIRVERCQAASEQMCGYVVWLKTPLNDQGQPRVDFRNPDTKKRERLSLGHQMFMGLKPNSSDRYEGQVYNSEDGKRYDVTIWPESADVLNVRGCLVAFLCKTQEWKRVNDVAQGQLPGPTGGANGPRPDPEFAGRTGTASATGSTRRPAPTPAAQPKQP